MTAILDTGAEVTLMSTSTFNRLNLKLSPTKQKLKAANKSSIKVVGSSVLPIFIGGLSIDQKVLIVEQASFDLLLGSNFLKNFSSITLMLGDKKVKFDGETVVLV